MKTMRTDGTIALKLISPGWGSSGMYPADVLERDGPKVFTKGLKMYWNHATPAQEAERPEGDLRDLAATLTSNARWEPNGAQGPGLYADAQVFEGYRATVRDLAPHIGVSIRAMGRARPGEAEGRKGPIIEALVAAKSVDFVTEPGAGGRILQLFEAAGNRQRTPGGIVPEKEEPMPLTEAEAARIAALEESNRTLTAQLGTALQGITTLTGQLAGQAIATRARALAESIMTASTLPVAAREAVVARATAAPAVKDGALDEEAFTKQVREAAQAEAAYLQRVGAAGGAIVGMGEAFRESADEPKPEAVTAQLTEAFKRLTGDDKAATIAAAGR
jgi:hypothetical protein